MEVVQGKATDKKIRFAQEIAFAKVLAGNNKTLRDRALKKLKKWLKVRGDGKWAFSEEEFICICTGLFYSMWMSDKFLVQEELAENISQLIHCFRKNQQSALLFIKCFHKRLLMEYEGLDQYRIDKFNMLIRRFLRQCFEYCKRINWDDSFLKSMTQIICDVIFHKDSALGYVLHFMNIYPEELAKVSRGKLENKTVLFLIEPFLKVLAQTREDRIQNGAIEVFSYFMHQTDAGIEFEEKFKVWKQMGFPGRSLNSIKKTPVGNGYNSDDSEDIENDGDDDEDDDEGYEEPMDPRAGSVHVDLPQIPLDIDSLLNLFKKYERGKMTSNKNKRKIRELIQKFSALRRGKFPARIKKDEIIDEKTKAPRLTTKTAKRLLQYTEEIDSGSIKTKEFAKISKELAKQEEQEEEGEEEEEEENDDEEEEEEEENDDEEEFDEESQSQEMEDTTEENNEVDDYDDDDDDDLLEIEPEDILKKAKGGKKKSKKSQGKANKKKTEQANGRSDNVSTKGNKKKKSNTSQQEEKLVNGGDSANEKETAMADATETKKKRKKRRRKKNKLPNDVNGEVEGGSSEENTKPPPKKRESCNGNVQGVPVTTEDTWTPSKKNGIKRKILSNWQVQDLDESSPEYKSLKPQKVIKLEVKKAGMVGCEENQEPDTNSAERKGKKNEKDAVEAATAAAATTPIFWERAKAKAFKTNKSNEKKLFRNPLAVGVGNDSDSTSLRRISFALEKNMAQENDEYLEEVRNSPKVPFDGSKKPVQSALKTGLSPSPINPFYRLRKIKF